MPVPPTFGQTSLLRSAVGEINAEVASWGSGVLQSALTDYKGGC